MDNKRTHQLHAFLSPERWKSHFRASRFQIFLGEHAPRPPYGEGGLTAPLKVTAAYYSFNGRLYQMLLKPLVKTSAVLRSYLQSTLSGIFRGSSTRAIQKTLTTLFPPDDTDSQIFRICLMDYRNIPELGADVCWEFFPKS